MAAVHAAKTAKYFRHVLESLGFPPTSPTTLHIDNKAAVDMIMENRPTSRSRHVDIQAFAIQEWRARLLVRVSHLSGILNCSDTLTKSVGPTLHGRHARRILGHFGPR